MSEIKSNEKTETIGKLTDARKLLMKAKLAPLQGDRFQPTGFPDLGAAEYQTPDGRSLLLVESTQSMANRMEKVCWDDNEDDLVEVLRGMPYVKVNLADGAFTTSLHESHRMGSSRIINNKKLNEVFKAEFGKGDRPFDLKKLANMLFKYDPNSLIHGVWISGGFDTGKEKLGGGQLRMQRIISGFIEAENISRAVSGGVKKDYVDPGKSGGEGNVPYPRTEYMAGEIVAYFNIDLAHIRSLGLDETAQELLTKVSIYKAYKCLKEDLRLRTACDLKVIEELTARDENDRVIELDCFEDIEAQIPDLITSCRNNGTFTDPAVTLLEDGSK